jgi:hypothetical protein
VDSPEPGGFRLLDYALASLISVVAWIGRATIHRVNKLEEATPTYSTRDDIKELRREMTAQHNLILDRLNEIADRVPR